MTNRLVRCGVIACAAGALGLFASHADASMTFAFSDPSGLGAEAEFSLLDSTTMQIRLQNTSTGAPASFVGAAQLLTGISWDFDPPGLDATTAITGGSVVIGPTSQSVNFDTGSYGPGTDVSGEYGYGNMDGTGALPNFVSSVAAVATPFGGANLDGPSSIDGPQGGLVANPIPVSLGGQGAIQDEIYITVTLSNPVDNLDFLNANGVRVEFGSDAAFITVPAPASMGLMAFGGLLAVRRRRRA